tara:strand:- start:730 stop:1563 length:834 start_codon:yes stop_codon:yes gene_type:complete
MISPKVTLIIATYNAVDWLKKVLLGYKVQTYSNFEIIIADDGSDVNTKNLIDGFKKNYPVNITHLWHEDLGYRRQTILNEAIVMAKNEYIVFTDGDCIPKNNFIELHAKYASKGRFISGGYCKLDMPLSNFISKDSILNGECFDVKWLNKHGNIGSSQFRKLATGPRMSSFLDLITTSRASFNNCNSSAWKSDLLAINGYDERMLYGGPDRELGSRLENYKVSGKQVRHTVLCLHLDHPRGYKTKESLDRNLAIRASTKKENKVWTDYGIVKDETNN